MNPFSVEMMKVYHTHRLLHGMDRDCAGYLAFSATLPTVTEGTPVTSAPKEDPAKGLSGAIRKGLKAEAGALTRALLESRPPLEIVNNEIIPALDAVGLGYEENKIYLPQLLMSAEAAKAAFEEIKKKVSASNQDQPEKGPVILATVKGDVHDIGKNIVKLLLENYGFSVIDLGKDVPPERIVGEVFGRKAPLVGLSALMTTTVPAMEETIRQLRQACPLCKIMVGGAVLTREYADRIGADFYGKDAMSSVRYAEQVVE